MLLLLLFLIVKIAIVIVVLVLNISLSPSSSPLLSNTHINIFRIISFLLSIISFNLFYSFNSYSILIISSTIQSILPSVLTKINQSLPIPIPFSSSHPSFNLSFHLFTYQHINQSQPIPFILTISSIIQSILPSMLTSINQLRFR